MNGILEELSRLWSVFVGWIPNLLSAIIAFIVGWIIALILKSASIGLLRRLAFNRKVEQSSGEGVVNRISSDPSRSIGNFVYWTVMIITALVAISYLQIPVINEFIVRIYSYIPNIVGSIFILGVALAISASLARLITRWMGDTITGKVIATVIPTVILSVAGFAILEQLRVAPVIISTTYIAIIGALALSSAISFGLGGRDVASHILEDAYDRSVRSLGQARKEIERGAQRARSDAQAVYASERRKSSSSRKRNTR